MSSGPVAVQPLPSAAVRGCPPPRIQDQLPDPAPHDANACIDVHLVMLQDPVIAEQPVRAMEEHSYNAEWALKTQAHTLVEFFGNIEDSYLFTSGIYFEEPLLKKGYEKIKNKTRYYRLGGDCYMYGMLASGFIDIVVEDTLKAHDYMALVNVIEGAGGRITDKFGKAVTIESDGSLIASCNSIIHDKLITLINN